jgi:Ser/Thr protein kinase RdoA (MazF antagonist)
MTAAGMSAPPASALAAAGRFGLGDGAGAILITRLPGRPAGDVSGIDDLGRCRERGRACGRIHSALATVTAPPTVPAVPDQSRHQLLHLDLHFLNVLVGDDDQVTGVLDWANTAAGDPTLDRARTWTILRLDPAVRSLPAGVAALVEGWVEEAGLDGLPETEPAAVAWACRYMLRDLAGRYRPEELAHVACALRRAP